MADTGGDRWGRQRKLFAAAVEQPADRRAAFIEANCADDPQLAGELRLMIEADAAVAGPLDVPLDSALVATVGPAANRCGRSVSDDHGVLPAVPGYRLIRPLGRGSMGVVYGAVQESTGQTVALKLMREELAGEGSGSGTGSVTARLQREVRALVRLRHPGIARLLDAGASGGRAFLAMELVEGEAITAFAAGRALPLPARLALLAEVCDAIAYAHQRGVIHRDLKPANILVDTAGRPRVLDFGVARLIGGESESQRTLGDGLVGTAAYMSPEQASGGEVDTRTDLYSLGVVAVEVISGRLPYAQRPKGVVEALRMAAEARIEPLHRVHPDLRGDLGAVLAMALAREPDRRYRSAAQLADDLRRVCDGQPVSAREATAFYLAGALIRRHRLAAGGIAAAVAMIGIAGTVAGVQAVRAGQAERLAVHRAESLEGLALELLSFVNQLQPVPGTMDQRGAVLERVLPALNKLAEQEGGNVGLRRTLARAYHSMATHLGGPNFSNLGRPAEAIEAYHKAIRFYEADGSAPLTLADVRTQLALLYFTRGDHAQSIEQSTKVIALCESLLAGGPAPEALERLAGAYRWRIRAMLGTEQKAGAPGLAREAGARLASLLHGSPRTEQEARAVAVAYIELSRIQHETGELEAALESLQRSIAAAVDGLRTTYGPVDEVAETANTRRYLAQVLVDLGRLEEAISTSEEAIEGFRRLDARSPGMVAVPDLMASTMVDLVIPLAKLGRLDEARARMSEGAAIYRALLDQSPADQRIRRNFGLTFVCASDAMKLAAAMPGCTHDERRALLDEAMSLLHDGVAVVEPLEATGGGAGMLDLLKGRISALEGVMAGAPAG